MDKKVLFTLISAMLLILSLAIATAENIPPEITGGAVEPVPEQPPESSPVICNEEQCDESCVKCSDRQCHEPGFACEEKMEIDKITPNVLNLGANEVKVMIRNTGNVNFKDVSVTISGDGIHTTEGIMINELPAGERMPSVLQLEATKSGEIDVVVKIFVGDEQKSSSIEQLRVIEEQKEEPKVDELMSNLTALQQKYSELEQQYKNLTDEEMKFNLTEMQANLTKLKEKYILVEEDYQIKKEESYDVSEIIYDKLREVNEYIKNSQIYLVDESYKKAMLNLKLAEEELDMIQKEINLAKIKKKTFGTKIKDNMIYIGSIAAAIVSTLTAISLVRSHINKQKLADAAKKVGSMGSSVGSKLIRKGKIAEAKKEDKENKKK